MRHWIIGNGKSIQDTPLELLKDEITWGINRPPMQTTYYFCMDIAEKDAEWKNAIEDNLDSKKVYLYGDFKKYFSGDNVEWIERCKAHHFYAADNVDKRVESWHLPTICTAFGSMYTILQLAVLNGATEIYLVGCDLFTGQGDHYDSNYPEFANWQERNVIENHIHTVSKRSCPVPIFNATVGGNLEIYPRVDIHKILKGK